MAVVSITLEQVGTVEIASPNYKLVNTITAYVDIPDDGIFLFREADDEFERVCSVADYETYPTVSTPGISYYRLNTVTTYDTSSEDGQNTKEAIQQALQILVSDLQTSINEFEGTVETVFTS